ncbi:MAG: CDP-diacylglycerol--serine O-phosphatidyltransferase [Chlamydia sp. 32-24]|nr:MAG: CDP-diacylglycerol--serine O-phosphatidyltransferase [Chlamydia sp. 32-24]
MSLKTKIYILPNIITAFGLCCGLFVIFKMNMTPVGLVNQQDLILTAILFILAAFADLLDGAIARIVKAESDFGGLFDSLSDAITFGVAPSVIILKSLSLQPGTDLSFMLTSAAMVFTVCGVLRLVRFNVASIYCKNDQELQLANKKNFTGLPIPAAAAGIISSNLFLLSEDFQNNFILSENLRMGIIFFELLLLGYLMVSRWKFPSLKTLHIPIKTFEYVFLIALASVFLFYGFLYYFPITFFLLAWGYIVIAWFLSFTRYLFGKYMPNTLEDFEPDEDEFDDHSN